MTDSRSAADCFDDAVELVREAGGATCSFLQRSLGIGYIRAAKLIEMMEDRGIIGPRTEASPRREFIPPAIPRRVLVRRCGECRREFHDCEWVEPIECPDCRGRGIIDECADRPDRLLLVGTCSSCEGSGRLPPLPAGCEFTDGYCPPCLAKVKMQLLSQLLSGDTLPQGVPLPSGAKGGTAAPAPPPASSKRPAAPQRAATGAAAPGAGDTLPQGVPLPSPPGTGVLADASGHTPSDGAAIAGLPPEPRRPADDRAARVLADIAAKRAARKAAASAREEGRE